MTLVYADTIPGYSLTAAARGCAVLKSDGCRLALINRLTLALVRS